MGAVSHEVLRQPLGPAKSVSSQGIDRFAVLLPVTTAGRTRNWQQIARPYWGYLTVWLLIEWLNWGTCRTPP